MSARPWRRGERTVRPAALGSAGVPDQRSSPAGETWSTRVPGPSLRREGARPGGKEAARARAATSATHGRRPAHGSRRQVTTYSRDPSVSGPSAKSPRSASSFRPERATRCVRSRIGRRNACRTPGLPAARLPPPRRRSSGRGSSVRARSAGPRRRCGGRRRPGAHSPSKSTVSGSPSSSSFRLGRRGRRRTCPGDQVVAYRRPRRRSWSSTAVTCERTRKGAATKGEPALEAQGHTASATPTRSAPPATAAPDTARPWPAHVSIPARRRRRVEAPPAGSRPVPQADLEDRGRRRPPFGRGRTPCRSRRARGRRRRRRRRAATSGSSRPFP